MPTGKKEDKIVKIIDSILKQVFGEEATQFIYKYLEHNYSLRQSEFSQKIDAFAKGLEDCLSSGALAVENKILNDIYSIYGSLPQMVPERVPEVYDFASQIRIATQQA
jgi:hypothetical protein